MVMRETTNKYKFPLFTFETRQKGAFVGSIGDVIIEKAIFKSDERIKFHKNRLIDETPKA